MHPSNKPRTTSPSTIANRVWLSALLALVLLVGALSLQTCDAFGSINIYKHRYPFYGGYGYPFFGGGYGGGHGGISIGGGGWGRR